MGRQLRMVPADWQHPKNEHGHFAPLYDGFNEDVADWHRNKDLFIQGKRASYGGEIIDLAESDRVMSFEEWYGKQPNAKDYMPDWPSEQRTHLMMYEDCTEGTPISPAFTTPEELARWLTDNKASAFGSQTANYESWLATIKAGWTPSMIISSERGIESGVEFQGRTAAV